MSAGASQIPVISADAGDPQALSDPNSPASIMKKAKESQAQTAADTKFDAPPPPREGFATRGREGFVPGGRDWFVARGREGVIEQRRMAAEVERQQTIISALFLATAALLLLYKAASD